MYLNIIYILFSIIYLYFFISSLKIYYFIYLILSI